jgi:hypothetical protein
VASKVFISYRREDSAPYAGRIQDRLEREFGRDGLFMDVDSIPLGMNFAKLLSEEVAKCGVLLVVIGPHWLDARDENGTRRLESPTDVVRIEIAAALEREIPVIPILVDNARIPKADQLPSDVRELAWRNGLNVRHDSFRTDMDKLIYGLKAQISAQDSEKTEAPLQKTAESALPPANMSQREPTEAELSLAQSSKAGTDRPDPTVFRDAPFAAVRELFDKGVS